MSDFGSLSCWTVTFWCYSPNNDCAISFSCAYDKLLICGEGYARNTVAMQVDLAVLCFAVRRWVSMHGDVAIIVPARDDVVAWSPTDTSYVGFPVELLLRLCWPEALYRPAKDARP
eukprot:scaffold2263_cov272-Pinguiococcus_pyrenoidosus.AAC.1